MANHGSFIQTTRPNMISFVFYKALTQEIKSPKIELCVLSSMQYVSKQECILELGILLDRESFAG